MPTPNKKETREEFLKRCMAYPDLQKFESNRRYAVCVSLWDNKGKKKE